MTYSEAGAILDALNTWLQRHPEVDVCHSIEHGEMINGDIAGKFFGFYKTVKSN